MRTSSSIHPVHRGPQESNPELLDVSGVARLLGCSSRHVRRLADSGRMPRPVRLGALVRWPRAAVVEWIGSGCPSCDPRRKGGAR